jgi:translation initiation factor 4A
MSQINDVFSENEITSWDDFNDLKSDLLRGIYAYGFESPSPIQSKAINPMISGTDLIAQAQSGTGKTGCFTIGTLQRIDTSSKTSQALILSPTRELSIQIKSVIDNIGKMMKDLTTKLLVGGTSIEDDSEVLSSIKPHVVIGCPGRVHDMLRRNKFSTSSLKIIVLDEADQMLSHGFKEQVYTIFQFLPKNVQVCLFSATLPDSINAITDSFMRNPTEILVKTEKLTLEGIHQYYVALDSDSEKYDALKDLYDVLSLSQCIIYCNSVRRVQELYDAMKTDNFPVCHIHSNMEKKERQDSYQQFRNGNMRVLISSNITARGIDIQQVSTVINFDIPKDTHTYLHRIGRSGRWGRKGTGINFVTRKDIYHMKEIERYYSTQIDELPSQVADTLNS